MPHEDTSPLAAELRHDGSHALMTSSVAGVGWGICLIVGLPWVLAWLLATVVGAGLEAVYRERATPFRTRDDWKDAATYQLHWTLYLVATGSWGGLLALLFVAGPALWAHYAPLRRDPSTSYYP